MKPFLFFLVALLLNFFSANAQDINPSNEEGELGDTLETIISDSTIIYVIKKAPVEIRETFELVKPKEKKPFYFSIGPSFIYFTENMKAQATSSDYVSKLNARTHNNFSYAIGFNLWRCNKKIYNGFDLNFIRLNQSYSYTDPFEKNNVSKNHFNYLNMGIHIGYWFRKNKNLSFILHGGIHEQYLISFSGFTLKKADASSAVRLRDENNFQNFTTNFNISFKTLVGLKELMIGVEPFFMIAPFSATDKKQSYSIRRNLIGLKISFVNII